MVSKKLPNFRTILHEYEAFKSLSLHIIRGKDILFFYFAINLSAHRLLWAIGIAHDDMSLDYLSQSDFDLASIMEPTQKSSPYRHRDVYVSISAHSRGVNGKKN